MKSLISSIIAITIAFSSSIYAQDSVSLPTKIKSIYSKNNGTSFVTFEANKLPGCYSNRGAYLSSGTDISKIYSMLLAAKLADKEVVIYYNFNDVAAGYTGWSLCYIEAVSLN